MKKQQLHNLSWARSLCSQSQQLVLLGMRSSVCPASSGSASSGSPSSPPLLPRAALLHPHPLKHILKLLIPPRVRFLNSFGRTAKIPLLLREASLVLAPDSSGCTVQDHPSRRVLPQPPGCRGCSDTLTYHKGSASHPLLTSSGLPTLSSAAHELSDAVAWDSHVPWLAASSSEP